MNAQNLQLLPARCLGRLTAQALADAGAAVLKPGAKATPDELVQHTRSLIASYKAPRSIEFVEALPLSGAGKILKRELRARNESNPGRVAGSADELQPVVR
jgi:acyl-CoA synthetase (AMP-forming)/AMP-acid ligase II